MLSVLLILVCTLPLVFVFINSFKTTDEYTYNSKFALPAGISPFFENINKLLELGIFKHILNSVIIVSIGVLISVALASMAGFAFSKLKFPGKNLIYWVTIGILALPGQVFIIPLYVNFAQLDLIDNLFSLGLIYSIVSFPFATFLIKSYCDGLPNELIEATYVDGGNNFIVYLKVIMPIAKPVLTTVAVINFFWFWNELFIGFIFNRTDDSRTITSWLALFNEGPSLGAGVTRWPLIYTGTIISLVIPFTVYFIFQNKIVKGITAGSVKG